ncbi:MAG: hypothetical protein JSW46_06155 [Gemmatimonadota bacterium]|nr:MAG: hypothetical protein JSW46_06155 [Gemmatimonadota bacterium]
MRRVCVGLLALASLAANTTNAQEREVTSEELESYFSERPAGAELRFVNPRSTQALPWGLPSVMVDSGSFIVLLEDEPAVAEAVPADWPWMPVGSYRLRLPVDALGVNAEAGLMGLQPVVVIEGGGLRYDGRAFRGSFMVGLEDRLNRQMRQQLAVPIAFAVTADADSISPVDLQIDHTNLPYERVRVVALAPGDSIRVDIVIPALRARLEISIPVIQPELRLEASPRRIQGWGLEVATLTILYTGLMDRPRVVVLSADRVVPEPSRVTLDEAGTGEAGLRSRSLGSATVRGVSPAVPAAEVGVEFAFPFAFLIAALLGGVIGGLARGYQKRAAADPAKRRSWWFYIIVGAFLGLAAAVAAAVGINLLPTPFVADFAAFNEAVVFVIAFIGGYYGLRGRQKTPPA